MRNSSKTRRGLRGFIGIFGFVLIGTLVIVATGLRDQLGRADIGLVLGSKVNRDGTPSLGLRARLDKTVELFREGYFPAVIASGGLGREGYEEAEVMRDYLVSHGIPKERVIIDNTGTTTFASAKNTLLILRQRKLTSVLVVSQYFHIARSRLALERFGISTVYSAHAHLFERRDLYSSPREFFGYLVYACRPYHCSDV